MGQFMNDDNNQSLKKMSVKKEFLRRGMEIELFVRNNPEFLNEVMNALVQNNQMSKELKALKLVNEARMNELAQRYNLMRDLLTTIYGERQQGLMSHYEALDRALQENDREVILQSLRGISSIISTNPLESFQKFSNIMEDDNQTLELDF